MEFYLLIALIICAITAQMIYISAKIAQVAEKIVSMGININHTHTTVLAPTPEYTPSMEEIEYEDDKRRIMDAAMALQDLFLDREGTDDR